MNNSDNEFYVCAGGLAVKVGYTAVEGLVRALDGSDGSARSGISVGRHGCVEGFNCADNLDAEEWLWIPTGAVVAVTRDLPANHVVL